MAGIVAIMLQSRLSRHGLSWPACDQRIQFLFQIGRRNGQCPVLPQRGSALQPVDLFGIYGAGLPATLHQPQALRQKREQHEGGQYLWPAKAFAREESAH